MKRIFLALLGTVAVVGLAMSALPWRSREAPPQALLRARFQKKIQPSVDHRTFPQLKGPFARPQDVTAACIGCHNGRAIEVMQSSHWNWERTEYVQGQGIRTIGKKNLLNNNCIGIGGNRQSCNKCHVGYGWGSKDFDFKNPLNIDCLACHDQSNLYAKAAGGAGMPDPALDLAQVAQRVGRPTRTNCGTCHFFGGGGNNVKHGDLEKALFDPTRDVDVHMASAGVDMACVDCHTAPKHQMVGKVYSVSSMNQRRVACESCHGALPHGDAVLDRHTQKVACQTCHIPVYAKVNPTKMTWDWSTAGQLKDGQPFTLTHPDGTEAYSSLKGHFTWGRQLHPEYIWFNGTASHHLLGDPVDPTHVVAMNTLHGSYRDPEAKIIPVKIHRGKQIYDLKHRILIQPKTVSTVEGDGGFWKAFDWQRAAAEGMKDVGLPFSGEIGFIATEMTWPINHMVSAKQASLECTECHVRSGGRLDKLRDFYLPGRDVHPWLEGLGKGMLWFTLLGVLAHGSFRWLASRRRKGV